jgi:hypothetical protein
MPSTFMCIWVIVRSRSLFYCFRTTRLELFNSFPLFLGVLPLPFFFPRWVRVLLKENECLHAAEALVLCSHDTDTRHRTPGILALRRRRHAALLQLLFFFFF